MNMSFWEYFPAVESPFEVIKNLSFYKQSTKKEVDSISHGEMVIRPINNLDEILEIYPNIKDKSDLSVGLMGKKCEIKTLERSKRALAENNNNTLNISLVVGRISFWSDQAPWIKVKFHNVWIRIQIYLNQFYCRCPLQARSNRLDFL